jgi:hypothetical protein
MLNDTRLGIYMSYDVKENGLFENAMYISNNNGYLICVVKPIINRGRFVFPTIIVVAIKGQEQYFIGRLLDIKRIEEVSMDDIKKDHIHRPPEWQWWPPDKSSYEEFKSILYIQALQKESLPQELINKHRPQRPAYYDFYRRKRIW